MLSVLENLFAIIKLRNSGIRSNEAGCYRNSKLVSSLRGLGHQDCHFQQLTQEGLRIWRKIEIYKFSTEKMTDLVKEIPFFPTTARRTASAGESNDGNDGSSYQCPEPGCDEDFKTQADLDFHMN